MRGSARERSPSSAKRSTKVWLAWKQRASKPAATPRRLPGRRITRMSASGSCRGLPEIWHPTSPCSAIFCSPSLSQQPKGGILETESIRDFAKGTEIRVALQDNAEDYSVSAITGRRRGHDHDPSLHRRPHEGSPRPQPAVGDGHELRGAAPPGARHCAHA